jgi:4'-phosphopantetheinyl transferase EntD
MIFSIPSVPLHQDNFFISRVIEIEEITFGIARFNSHWYRSTLCDRVNLKITNHFPHKSQAQYSASRFLAKKMMEFYGVKNFNLLNASDRSPIWPRDISGSLSHNCDTVILAVTRKDLLIGIDVETFMDKNTAQEVAGVVMMRKEIEKIQHLPIPFRVAITIVFSLKESLYKALWPKLHQEIDFCHVSLIDIDYKTQCATLRLHKCFQKFFSHDLLFQTRFSLGLNKTFTMFAYPPLEML